MIQPPHTENQPDKLSLDTHTGAQHEIDSGSQPGPPPSVGQGIDNNADSRAADGGAPSRSNSDTAPSDGTTLYYSLLGTGEKSRDICAYLHLYQTLGNVLVEVREPTVAEKKIHWWHEEIDRLFRAQSRHPACQRLQNSADFKTNREHDKLRLRLLDIFKANNNEKFLNAVDPAAMRERLLLDYGNRVAIVVDVLAENPISVSYQENLSLGLGLFDRLRQSHRLHHHGLPIWPDSTFDEYNLQPDQLTQAAFRQQSSALFKSVIHDAVNYLDQAIAIAKHQRDDCKSVLPLTVNAALRKKQLTLWLNKSINPIEKYVTLTPFNKAWTSWRCRSTLS